MKTKRLIRKAGIDRFISNLIYDNIYDQNEVTEIVNSNSDCLYSGKAYRVFFFDSKNDIVRARNEYMKENNIQNARGNGPEIMWGTIDKLILANSEYQSFSKSISGINSVKHHMAYDQGDFSITIEFNISNGLDIEKLYNKYEDVLDDYAKQSFDDFSDQEEVLAKFDSDEFNLVNAMNVMEGIIAGRSID